MRILLSDKNMKPGYAPEGLLNWLSSYDHGSAHHRLLSRRAKGTGTWILQNTQLNQWWESARASIWCSGIRMYPTFLFHISGLIVRSLAGAGKTILTLGMETVR